MSQFKLVMPVKLRLFLLMLPIKKFFDVYLLTKLHSYTAMCIFSLLWVWSLLVDWFVQ